MWRLGFSIISHGFKVTYTIIITMYLPSTYLNFTLIYQHNDLKINFIFIIVFRITAKSYSDNKGVTVKKFGTNNLPGDDWARSLLKRHQIIGQRIATNISRVRADVSPTIINECFDNLKQVLENVPPDNIFNYDESNLQDDPGKQKVLFKRGTKYPVKVQNHSKSATTIMVCGSAAGTLLPPYIVYRSAHM